MPYSPTPLYGRLAGKGTPYEDDNILGATCGICGGSVKHDPDMLTSGSSVFDIKAFCGDCMRKIASAQKQHHKGNFQTDAAGICKYQIAEDHKTLTITSDTLVYLIEPEELARLARNVFYKFVCKLDE